MSASRLDSWKEIAVFLRCGERTVKRWEKERGLPIHRVPGAGRGRVFAYSEELTDWLRSPQAGLPDPEEPAELGAGPSEPAPLPIPQPASRYLWRPWAAVLAVSLLAGVVLLTTSTRNPGTGLGQAAVGTVNAATLTSSNRHIPDQAARDLYLKGRFYWAMRTPEGLNQALDYFNQAVARDPQYADAYAGLADCYDLLREYTHMPASEAFPLAIAAAQKAIQLDDNSAGAHAALAFADSGWTWDTVAAEREFRRALQLNPADAKTHHWYGTFLCTFGRFDEALAELDRAQQLDPSSKAILADKGLVLSYAGRTDEAIALLKQIEASDADFLSPHNYLADIYFFANNLPLSIQETKTSARLSHDLVGMEIARAAEAGFAAGGRQGSLESTLTAQKRFYDRGLVAPGALACTYALLDRKAEALQFLHLAADRKESVMTWIGVARQLQGLHDEPAFQELLKRVGRWPGQRRTS